MRIIQVENQVDGGRVAFELLKEKLAKGAKTLGLATGSSPLSFYEQIVESDLDLTDLTSVNLDEYIGLSGENPQSYRYFMQEHLFDKKPFKESFLPNGVAENAEAEIKRYNHVLAEHPVDLQILGIGTNGHIGFNEPSDHFENETHCVDLTETTIQANKRFFDSEKDVPKQAYTMGIGTIMRCRKILVVVNGKDKAEILKQVIQGPVTPEVPGSILQFHPDCTIIADEDALSAMDF